MNLQFLQQHVCLQFSSHLPLFHTVTKNLESNKTKCAKMYVSMVYSVIMGALSYPFSLFTFFQKTCEEISSGGGGVVVVVVVLLTTGQQTSGKR